MNERVTVIIPARNEKAYIGKCLDSFVSQTYPKELLKIYVCDGMSEDGTRDIVKEYEAKCGNIYLYDNVKLSAPAGMNTGIRNSRSDIIIIFGAHAYADRDFVANNVKALTSEDIGVSGGPIETISENDIGRAIAMAMSSPFGVGNALFRYSKKKVYVDTVAFGAYWKRVLDDAGYFDEELVRNQDDELNFRVTEKGYRILMSPEIKSYYFSRSSYRKLWRQYFQYGFWKVRVMQKHGKTASVRHIVPLLFVLFNIVGGILGIIFHGIQAAWISVLCIYLLCDVFFSLRCSGNDGRYVLIMIPVFPILHLSYGIGFLEGLVNFYIINSKSAIHKNTQSSR